MQDLETINFSLLQPLVSHGVTCLTSAPVGQIELIT